jgi:hypothetical protein
MAELFQPQSECCCSSSLKCNDITKCYSCNFKKGFKVYLHQIMPTLRLFLQLCKEKQFLKVARKNFADDTYHWDINTAHLGITLVICSHRSRPQSKILLISPANAFKTTLIRTETFWIRVPLHWFIMAITIKMGTNILINQNLNVGGISPRFLKPNGEHRGFFLPFHFMHVRAHYRAT